MPNIWRLEQVTDTKFGANVSNEMLLNPTKYPFLRYYEETNRTHQITVNPELQLIDTKSASRNKLKGLLTDIKNLKFVNTFVLGFKKIESDDETNDATFNSSEKTETIVNDSDIHELFESIYSKII